MNRTALIALLMFSSVCTFAQSTRPARLLNYSITGSSNSESPAENATYAMAHPEVQRLLLDIAAAPRDRAYVEKALAGSGVSLNDMIANGSLRLQDEKYWLNFSLLTRADQEIIRRVTDVYSQGLANAVLARRAEIEKLLKSYDMPGIDPREVAFIVLGCFSLDWDGLELTTAKGYRAVPPKRPGGQFFFMAEETGGLSLQRIYWGSNNSSYGNYAVTTFGDHFSRRAELWRLMRKDAPLASMREDEVGRKLGAMMMALREGPQSAATLAKAAKIDTAQAMQLLGAIETIGWVAHDVAKDGTSDGDKYRATIPVLSARDKQMVAATMRVGREAMEAWLAANHDRIRDAVRDLTPVRHGVPYPQTFDQLWHYLFGIANQKLVEGGLFADPYAPGRTRPGYVAVVFDTAVNPGW